MNALILEEIVRTYEDLEAARLRVAKLEQIYIAAESKYTQFYDEAMQLRPVVYGDLLITPVSNWFDVNVKPGQRLKFCTVSIVKPEVKR